MTATQTKAPERQLPKVGDFATQGVGSDCYPFIVTKVIGAKASKLELKRLECRIVSGSFMSGDAVVEYWANPAFEARQANWAPKRGRYLLAGSPLSIGRARFYQDPSY